MKAKSHSLDEVIDYIVNVHGFVELDCRHFVDLAKKKELTAAVMDETYGYNMTKYCGYLESIS